MLFGIVYVMSVARCVDQSYRYKYSVDLRKH